MKMVAIVVAFAALMSVQATEVNPIGKVIQLLTDLEAKITAEGEAANKVFEEFTEWCEERSRNLGFDIKTGRAGVAELAATIEESGNTIAASSTKVEELAAAIATDESDLAAATKVRADEATSFSSEERELTEVISALGRAIGILEREMAKGGASMLQLKGAANLAQAFEVMVQASMFSSADASRLTALVQTKDEDLDLGAPAAAVYQGQSANIIDVLKDLLEKAETQLADAQHKEANALHNFEMLRQSLTDEVKFANKDMSNAKASISKAGVVKANAEGDLDVTQKSLNADTKAKADTHRDCMEKAQDYEAATKSRGEELKALAEAKKVISESTGGAEKIQYGLNQVSLFQLRSRVDLAKFEAVRFVRDLARQQKDKSLAQLAAQMTSAMSSSSGDVFAKVKGLIADMIARLEAESSADAEHKAFCDKETKETTAKQADKTAAINKLTTFIDQKSARSAKLKEEVAGLQKALADLTVSQAEMDKLRGEENAVFVANKADMEQGLEGVKLGLRTLREYYASDKSHEGAEGAGASIIGLLEVVESDFSKTLAEIITTESSAESSYKTETNENEIEKAAKEQDVKYKTKESVTLDKVSAEANADRKGVQSELDAVEEYLAKINEMCIAKAEPYAERAARRAAEIEGLKQALQILETEAASLIQTSRSLRGARMHIQ